jgi:hypothetical protein
VNKYISYYYLKDRLGTWPDPIIKKFSKNFTKYGGPWFYVCSDIEAEFEKECSSYNIDYYRKTILKATGKHLFDYPYFYLTVSTDRNIYTDEDFLDFSNICDEKVFFCGHGIKQYRKVSIDYDKSKLLDIMITPTKLRLLLISRKVKDIIEHNGLTGYRLIPCVEKGKKYKETDLLFDTYSKSIENNAQYFQLIVTEKVSRPPIVGNLIRIFSQCPKCKMVSGFDSDQSTYFNKNDLKNTDFQFYNEYSTSAGDTFLIPNDIYIISSRTLRHFLDNNIKGMTRYTTDPPIQYGVVEIR